MHNDEIISMPSLQQNPTGFHQCPRPKNGICNFCNYFVFARV